MESSSGQGAGRRNESSRGKSEVIAARLSSNHFAATQVPRMTRATISTTRAEVKANARQTRPPNAFLVRSKSDLENFGGGQSLARAVSARHSDVPGESILTFAGITAPNGIHDHEESRLA